MCLITWRPEEWPLKGRESDLRLTLTGFCFSAVSCMVFTGAKRSRWHKAERKKPKWSHSHHLCLPQLVHSPGLNGRGKLCRMPWPTILCKTPDCCLLCCEIIHMLEWKQPTTVFRKSCSQSCFNGACPALHPTPPAYVRPGIGLAQPVSQRLLFHWLFPTLS